MILMLPGFAIILLSNTAPFYSIGFQYSAHIIPLVFILTIAGIENLKHRFPQLSYRIMATTNGDKSIAIASLYFGKGMYLVTGLHNEPEAFAKDNAPLIENIMHFCVNWIKSRSGSGGDVS